MGYFCQPYISLRKISKIHLIFWYENFVEANSFLRVLGNSSKFFGICMFSHKVSTPRQVKSRYFIQCLITLHLQSHVAKYKIFGKKRSFETSDSVRSDYATMYIKDTKIIEKCSNFLKF